MKEKVTKLFSTVKAMWDKPLEGRFLNLKEILSFGMYSLGNSWIYNTIMLVITITYIPYFYGIDAIHGYTIYIGGSLINMFLVPLIGQAMEKKRTKWGRYKPYILFSLPLLALFTMMSMWAPQYSSEIDRVIYAYCSCVPVIAISTLQHVSDHAQRHHSQHPGEGGHHDAHRAHRRFCAHHHEHHRGSHPQRVHGAGVHCDAHHRRHCRGHRQPLRDVHPESQRARLRA